MLELLFLLLPLAFLSGWRASKKRSKKAHKDKRELSDNFVKGVNFLLNEQPDKALEVFLTHPEIDEYTAETYLLLGNMFRNRGEVDRALRVHQNLVGRSSLAKEQKTAAMLAYGEDFFAAGMLDRAESVFQELTDDSDGDIQACGTLRSIYEQLQDWDRAIEVAYRSTAKTGDDHSRLIVHYYCELAEQELDKGNVHLVENYLQEAAKVYAQSNRVLIIQGDLAKRKNDFALAFERYKAAIKVNPQLIGLLDARLIDVSKELGGVDKLADFLLECFNATPNSTIFGYLIHLSLVHDIGRDIRQELEQGVENCQLDISAILGIVKLWRKDEKENKCPRILEVSLEKYLQHKAEYMCNHCGYKMTGFVWRCPACHHWDTVAHI